MTHYLEKELYNLISNEPSIFTFLQSGSLDGLWYWDLEHPENEWMNETFWKLLGYEPSEKEHLATEWQDLINQDDLQVAIDNFNKHCADPNHPYDQIVRYKHRDGSTVWVRCRGVAIRDKNGKPVRMLGAHNDLTKLKHSEQQLTETNKFLNLILDTSPDLILVKDEQFRIVQGNKAFFNVYPKNQQDKIIGHTTLEQYDKEVAEGFLKHDKIAFEEGFSRTLETVLLPNGQHVIFDTIKVRFEDRHQKKFILGVAKDVTKEQHLFKELETKNKALESAHEEVENLLNASEVATVFINRSLKITRFTPSAKKLFNFKEKDINKSILKYVEQLNINNIGEKFKAALESNASFEQEVLSKHHIYYYVKIYPYLTKRKTHAGIVLTVINIHESKTSQKVIKESETLVAMAAKHSKVGIWNWRVQDDVLEWSDGMYELFSVPKNKFESLYDSFINTVLPEERDRVNKAVEQTITHKVPFNIEYQIYGPNNSVRYIHAIGQYAVGLQGESDVLTGMCFDITALKQAEQELSKIALYDNVTGIPNRANLLAVLPNAVARAKRQKSIFAVFFIDLDNFKHVNDSLGHHGGDILLKEVVKSLKNVLREEDFFARIGGDEFAVILEDVKNIEEIRYIAQRCLDSVTKEFKVLNQHISQSFSMGISVYPDSATTADQLLQYADTAMYRAKEKGKNNFVFFRDALDQRMQRQTKMEIALRYAVEKQEFKLLYQPQLNAQNKLISIEALIRWQNNEFRNISPEEFIPIAEKTRSITDIGGWVIQNAIKDWVELTKRIKNKELKLSINISSIQLFEKQFINNVLKVLSQFGFNPRNLILEITETHLMQDINTAKKILLDLSRYGIKIALDDFGKGYSSLNYLANLPISYLKIDKDFIRYLDQDNNDLIVNSMVSLAKNLNMLCVAEGVETLQQLQYLKKIGCHHYQGFYFSKPVAIDKIALLSH